MQWSRQSAAFFATGLKPNTQVLAQSMLGNYSKNRQVLRRLRRLARFRKIPPKRGRPMGKLSAFFLKLSLAATAATFVNSTTHARPFFADVIVACENGHAYSL